MSKKKGLKIGVVNMKGGVGKSVISLALSQHPKIDGNIITNDKYSLITEVFSEDIFLVENFDINLDCYEDLIVDFGGFIDSSMLNILDQMDYILVPTFSDSLSLKATLDTVEELRERYSNIIVIHNKATIEDNKVANFIQEYFENIPVIKVGASKLYKNALNESVSAYDFANKSNLNKYAYRKAIGSLNNLVNTLKGGN